MNLQMITQLQIRRAETQFLQPFIVKRTLMCQISLLPDMIEHSRLSAVVVVSLMEQQRIPSVLAILDSVAIRVKFVPQTFQRQFLRSLTVRIHLVLFLATLLFQVTFH